MIRGAIEVAQQTRVAGWIFSATDALRDKTVLAFVGSRCVGAGKVERFRQDLLDAKLGDGYCGFDFAIKLVEGETVGAVIVRLQFSDMALIQGGSVIAGAEDTAASGAPDLGAIKAESVSWMMDRGMLEQPEYDFLKAIQSAGAYERGLRMAKRAGGEAGGRLDPASVAHDMLSLLMLSDVKVARATTAALSELIANPASIRKAQAPVVALWSEERCRIALEERSHLGGRVAQGPIGEPLPGAIEYSFGPDRLLLVHRDCRFASRGTAPASGITIFSVAPAEVAVVRKPAVAQVRAA